MSENVLFLKCKFPCTPEFDVMRTPCIYIKGVLNVSTHCTTGVFTKYYTAVIIDNLAICCKSVAPGMCAGSA